MATTFGTLSVTISIGNAATQDPAQVAEMLRTAAAVIEARGDYASIESDSIRIADENGNRVGSVQMTGFEVVPDEDDDQ